MVNRTDMFRRVSLLVLLAACGRPETTEPPPPTSRPSILLVTLDTTRADSIGPDAVGVETPAFNALVARGKRLRQAYATAPQTLPSHVSMMTGLYPGGHGVHENARPVGAQHALIAEKLGGAGYATGAFVSAFPLDRRFGLARGFDVYDDELPSGREERPSRETTDRAIAWMQQQSKRPLFLWVHYFDPHAPYEPTYRGEIAAMDVQLGRLVAAFDERAGNDAAIVVAGDHGEGLGDHGEAQHGSLVYQSTMHVPLIVIGPGVARGVSDAPVSTRRIFHTLRDWAGLGAEHSLRANYSEVVLGEAMAPFLQYGWQPQVMAVDGRQKAIQSGALELYDVIADPAEKNDLAATGALSRGSRQSLRDYPIPSLEKAAPPNISEEEQRRLASLGYVTSTVRPVIRKDAPRPRDMVHLFDELDTASLHFTRGEYSPAIALFEKILADDPHNLMTALRLAAAHSALGEDQPALAAFKRAEAIAPDSPDVQHYLALHYASGKDWPRAVPMLERIVAESPDRLPAIEALATIRERQGRFPDALALRKQVLSMKRATGEELARFGELAMRVGDTAAAIDAFEKARAQQGTSFRHDLELGVLYLAQRRFDEARLALDRVPATHPAYAMALFKRAQVSVLLGEPDRAERIAAAKQRADATTRPLIANERLFAGQ